MQIGDLINDPEMMFSDAKFSTTVVRSLINMMHLYETSLPALGVSENDIVIWNWRIYVGICNWKSD